MRKNGKKWGKLKNQRFLLLLFVSVIIITQCTTSFAIPAIGVATDCPHHREHDESCGYVEAIEGKPCGHICDENCELLVENCPHIHDEECGFDEKAETETCTHVHTEACYETAAACTHEHDVACGYVEAVEGSECRHACVTCHPAGKLNLTEAVFDKYAESEQYQDLVLTFEKGADALVGVILKKENETEQTSLEYVPDDSGEKVTLEKTLLETLESGNYTVHLVMESGAQLSLTLTVVGGQEELKQEENESQEIALYAEGNWEPVAITAENFEDAIFREYVSTQFDTNKNRILEVEEQQAVTNVNVAGTITERHQIASLKGIEHFKNLTSLYCGFGDGRLNNLDLSANTKLQVLSAYHNGLINLNISTCVNLIELSIQQENKITELDISHCTKLAWLTIEGTSIKKLILPLPDENGQRHLKTFVCTMASLSYIEIGNHEKSQFTTLNVDSQVLRNLGMTYDASSKRYINRGRMFMPDTVFFTDEAMTTVKEGFQVVNGCLTISAEHSGAGTVYFKSETAFGLSGCFNYILPGQIEVKQAKALSEVNGLLNYLGVSGSVSCERFKEIQDGVPGRYTVTVNSGAESYEVEVEVVVAIDADNFEDEIFRENYVRLFDVDANGSLDAIEIDTITDVNVSGTITDRHHISSLKGIEYFKNLKALNCNYGDGRLKKLDLSANTQLQVLDAVHNGLTDLNISTCKNLVTLSIQQENRITELDIRHCTKLIGLACEGIPLETLYLPTSDENGVYHLQMLSAHNCKLTYLDLTNYTNLETVRLYHQYQDSLNLTKQDNGWVDSSGKVFASGVDSAGNPATRFYKTLHSWSGSENMSDELSFSVNEFGTVIADKVFPVIDPVYFQSKIPSPPGKEFILNGSFSYGATGNMTANTLYFDFREETAVLPEDMKELVNNFGITLGENVQYTVTCEGYEKARKGTIGAYPVTISYDQLSINATIEVGVRINAANFEDPQFRDYVATKDTGEESGLLTAAELDAVKSITISGTDTSELNQHPYTSLKGIEYFRKLQTLLCCYGKLTELDLSKNTELVQVWAYHNSLVRVDVSNSTKLEDLRIQRNVITELKLPDNSALMWLSCEGNRLTKDTLCLTAQTNLKTLNCCDMPTITALDLSQNRALKELLCSNDSLEMLDLSNHSALEKLYCSNNQLKELNLTNNTALQELACSKNALTKLEVNHLASLKNLDCAGNHLTSLEISELSSELVLDAEGQTVEKDLAMAYTDGVWKNIEKVGMEPVRTFHTTGTSFYDYDAVNQTAGTTALTEFSVSGGTLTTSQAFEIVDPVYFTTTLYENSGAERTGKLTGTFTYVPEYTLGAGTLFFQAAELRTKLQEAGVTEASDLKHLTGVLTSTPDLQEIKDAATVTLTEGSFENLKNGVKGTYAYQAAVGTVRVNGKIVVYADGESVADQLIVIPAGISLQRNFEDGCAEQKETIKLISSAGSFMGDSSVVKVSADADLTLSLGASETDRLRVAVYTVDSDGNESAYMRDTPLATLDKQVKTEQIFKLVSEDVSGLRFGEYRGTMNFTIQYCEEQ